MGRKFRLSVHRKYEEKRTTKLVVSIPLTVLTTVSIPLERLPFRVSWPLSVFTYSFARCLDGLQQRLSAAGGLPAGNSFCYYGHDCAVACSVLSTIIILCCNDCAVACSVLSTITILCCNDCAVACSVLSTITILCCNSSL